MLEVKGLNKTFGSMVAVHDENFKLSEGEILGLIGQNGAGKTTTFRMILDLLKPDSGEVLWDGKPFTQNKHDIVGFLPEERGLYLKMTIEQQVVYFAELRGQKPAVTKQKLDSWMEKFDVKGKKNDKIKDLSKGNQQKVQLIATLIHDPKFVILDEPFSGLDPVNASLLEQGIEDMRSNGSVIIYSSHDMGNVEKISDRLLMLRNGETVLNGPTESIRDSFGDTRIILQSPLTKEELLLIDGVESVEVHGPRLEISLRDGEVGKEVFARATKNGYIKQFDQQPPTLDEIFRMKVGENNE
ncbi:ABC transporter ATP-binding protein [Pediococcus claussenii]|uniref:ABC transporter family protein n=1 Tax=Pediococcus claussenii (strain ATCC BAA-344 / DSM 14800 / JCM 18046 / KCTC 3811 / LMG 21948 / P06) TaxID=701521 RepID=G8PEA1_PEDCP|nr:ABC transporter ATP-binding protein [Pediococcus claussenii]AEV94362.1 ABC transporter family protein [Pediococcus claussenii ATCC BAA-344]ANZ69584.1 sodium ABC transporter ATP-binding protein [Pediococcus claussenii]ANZ71401.1 sodium ABC transporter ATP-binding protein [Pediococcus claussenii]